MIDVHGTRSRLSEVVACRPTTDQSMQWRSGDGVAVEWPAAGSAQPVRRCCVVDMICDVPCIDYPIADITPYVDHTHNCLLIDTAHIFQATLSSSSAASAVRQQHTSHSSCRFVRLHTMQGLVNSLMRPLRYDSIVASADRPLPNLPRQEADEHALFVSAVERYHEYSAARDATLRAAQTEIQHLKSKQVHLNQQIDNEKARVLDYTKVVNDMRNNNAKALGHNYTFNTNSFVSQFELAKEEALRYFRAHWTLSGGLGHLFLQAANAGVALIESRIGHGLNALLVATAMSGKQPNNEALRRLRQFIVTNMQINLGDLLDDCLNFFHNASASSHWCSTSVRENISALQQSIKGFPAIVPPSLEDVDQAQGPSSVIDLFFKLGMMSVLADVPMKIGFDEPLDTISLSELPETNLRAGEYLIPGLSYLQNRDNYEMVVMGYRLE
ncbi:hypothetical protein BJ742DRAFT_536472 [Cladochytrium replicatum]|nr:hypothetical protein BJ742DRAFT_536472 [Cladochytrium replicatum]